MEAKLNQQTELVRVYANFGLNFAVYYVKIRWPSAYNNNTVARGTHKH